MIANLLNTLVGIVLAYAVVLHPTWIEQQYFPLLGFAAVIFVLAIWARLSDPHPWYSWVNMVLAVLLGILALFPLATQTFSNLAFWGPFWVGCTVPVVALWSALYQRDLRKAARAA
ncbi:MAG: hypothetical protein WCZ18_00060 [Ottowia sp.]|nr:hypothetical protein [Ottowia sp.]